MISPELYFAVMLITNPQKAIRILTAEDWENFFMDLFDDEWEDIFNGTFLKNEDIYIDRIVDKYLDTTGVLITSNDSYSREVIDKAYKTATQIQETTKKNILNAPIVGIGKSTPDDSDELRNFILAGIAFSASLFNTDEIKKWFSKDRANLIALNEANWIYNHEEYFEALASKKTKTWHTALDEKVRLTHIEQEGKTIPIDDYFHVGTSLMLYPLDTSMGASAGEIINCRCSVSYNS